MSQHTQPVQQGAQLTAADRLNQILVNNWEMFVIVLGLVILAVLLYKIFKKVEPGELQFEGTDLEQRVLQNLKARSDFVGKKTDKKLYYGEFEEISPIRVYINLTQPSEEKVTSDKIPDDAEMEEVKCFILSDGTVGELKKTIQESFDKALGRNKYRDKVVIVSEKHLEVHDDKIVIDPQVRFEPNGGILCEKNTAADNVINEIVVNETLQSVRKSIPDYVEKINLFDSKYSQGMGFMDKMADMDRQSLEDTFRKH